MKELLELASQLSSDASFFLYGDTALAEGRGEIVTQLPPLPHRWVVLMVPPVLNMPGKTKRLYASLNNSHYTKGQITDELVTLLKEGREVTSASLYNVFDKVATDDFAGLGKYQEQFLRAGAGEIYLAGSGPALFTLEKDKSLAEQIYQNLREQGLEYYLVETLPAIERSK
jgi:4-diphosphocytidyl-2-C-methyl-D-erythritol kinase